MRDDRRFIIFCAICIAFIIGVLIATSLAPVPKVELEGKTYTIMQGDTLWSIADEFCPNEMDLREYINKLESENGITADIYPGQIITVWE